jgi:sugar/nucleoside kinase (ribokinase family)
LKTINYKKQLTFSIEMDKKYDVCGVGAPFIDILINVEDHHLDKFKLTKGGTQILDNKKFDSLLKYFKTHKYKIASGGDCANTLVGIASLGGKAVFSGNVGLDKHGIIFEQELVKEGVECNISKHKGKTSTCIVLVTPDSERSFTNLFGECLSKDFSVNKEHVVNSKYVYMTGHMFHNEAQKKAVFEVLDIAKENNIKVAFDLGDPLVVKSNKALFYDIVKGYVDVLFANEAEAEKFTNEKDYRKALDKISKLVDVVVIKLGDKGSVIKYKNKIINIKPYKANAIDTTGAGDLYSAGFLYGLTHNLSLEKSGKIASYLSSRVVEKLGARLDASLKEMIKKI